jgi:Leucine-rich repeat (LRR) protein
MSDESVQISQRDVLILLYESLGGEQWNKQDNWGTNAPLTEWFGIREVDDDGNVLKIQLDDNNLSGSLPEQIGCLKNLKRLCMSRNKLVGSIPVSIAMLTSLEEIRLSNNFLEGEISSTLLHKLIDMRANGKSVMLFNNLGFTFPTEIENIKKIRKIDLSFCSMRGKIPDALGDIETLDELRLNENALEGSIPTSVVALICRMRLQKKRVELHDNNYGLALPEDIGDLDTEIEVLDLSDCSLSGRIPKSIGKLKQLVTVNLEKNKLEGTIPSTIGNIVALKRLKLLSNELDGPIPQSLSRCSNLQVLQLDEDMNSKPFECTCF